MVLQSLGRIASAPMARLALGWHGATLKPSHSKNKWTEKLITLPAGGPTTFSISKTKPSRPPDGVTTSSRTLEKDSAQFSFKITGCSLQLA